MIEKKSATGCADHDYCAGWNDAVDAMPRWISVEERLPEPKEDVALYIRCGDVSFIRTGWRMGNGQFICPNDSLSGYEVTHWMPIPQPPKEG